MAPRKLRPIRIEGNVAYVPLTRGYEAIIDAADVPSIVRAGCWRAEVTRHTVYATRLDRLGGRYVKVYMHRYLAGPRPDLNVDHVDGNGLNNRDANLRVATPSQNNCNQRRRSDNTSGYKGVGWFRPKKRWRARVGVGGKSRTLGYFDTPEQAHAAYVEAAEKLHGAFARPA